MSSNNSVINSTPRGEELQNRVKEGIKYTNAVILPNESKKKRSRADESLLKVNHAHA
jgi:hypothetical protein